MVSAGSTRRFESQPRSSRRSALAISALIPRESIISMAPTSCLAGINTGDIEMLRLVLRNAGTSPLAGIAALNVSALGKRAPELIVCDVDGIDVDPLELLRRLRFVLPDCMIAVYTGVMTREWARACHLAGASCLLSKNSTATQLTAGLSDAFESGCFTDPLFVSVAYGAA
jgi:CheY-like chemotaxis protein